MALSCWCTPKWRQLILVLLVSSACLVIAEPLHCPTNESAVIQHIGGWDYQGCYNDHPDSRLLPALNLSSPNLTVTKCAKFCSSHGYTLFGVEFQHQCYCDNNLPLNATKNLADQSKCNVACCGDGHELCGGTWFMGVYRTHPHGRNFGTAPRIGVGVTLGILVLLITAIVGWKYHTRHRQSDEKSETLGLAAPTRGKSRSMRDVWQGAHKLWRSCLNWLKVILQRSHDGETQSDRAVLLGSTIVRQDSLAGAIGANLEDFNRDIWIEIANPEPLRVRARLDTQCDIGNWISKRLVEDMKRTHEIVDDKNRPTLMAGNGHPITSHGSILLNWKWDRGGTILRQRRFFILPPESDHLDVIFGAKFIKSEGLLSVNQGAFLPLTQHRGETEAEKEEREKRKKEQEEKKEAIEAQRKAYQTGQQQQQRGGGSSQGSRGNQGQ